VRSPGEEGEDGGDYLRSRGEGEGNRTEVSGGFGKKGKEVVRKGAEYKKNNNRGDIGGIRRRSGRTKGGDGEKLLERMQSRGKKNSESLCFDKDRKAQEKEPKKYLGRKRPWGKLQEKNVQEQIWIRSEKGNWTAHNAWEPPDRWRPPGEDDAQMRAWEAWLHQRKLAAKRWP